MTPAVWVAIGSLIVAFASLSYTVYDKRRSTLKRIGWRIVADAPLLPRSPTKSWQQLKVVLENETVQRPRVVAVEFINSGRIELKKDDFALPPKVTMPDGRILATEVNLRTHGSDAGTPVESVHVTENSVDIEGRLLNPGDAVVFRVLLDGGQKPPVPSLQAAGFKFGRHSDDAGRLPPYVPILKLLWNAVAIIATTALITAAIAIFGR